MIEFVIYVCIDVCVLTTFDPPALFDTIEQCKAAAPELRDIVVEAVRWDQSTMNHPEDWTFNTYDACAPYEPLTDGEPE